ncbi:uncharacterized protein LOC124721755 isoform X1 [Schistocerca piceifrons]|uniref:uncharacterized protein LOC124721755 isoform X1 n=1 Tax=Schistocerca piceifrons TaxID=274613 RepID=UPI001F5F3CB1|nr:uncharacterized protein LOC124721755 isoform X1 [Schistocerca piceifrons]
MGINSSKSTKKASNSFSGISPNNSLKSEESNKSYTNILVLSRMGSMFFDEDGDLAHEFYIEVPPPKKGCKATMKRVLHNLIPQVPQTEDVWKDIIKDFENRWNFSCFRGVEGKPVVNKCPPKRVSEFHNCNGTFNIVLFAVADSN